MKRSDGEKRNRMNGKARIEYILRIARGHRFDGKDIEMYIYICIYICQEKEWVRREIG